MGKKYTYNQVQKLCEDSGFILVDKNYTNSRTKMEMICVKCGSKRITKFAHIMSGHGCRKCSGSERYTENEVKQIFLHKNIKVVEAYVSNSTKLEVVCLKCDFSWKARLSNTLKGAGCPFCSKKAKYTYEQVMAFVEDHNGKLLSSEYKNVDYKLNVMCNKCETSWTPTFRNMKAGSWCPTCADYKPSKMQNKIEKILKDIFPNKKIISNFKGFSWLKYKKQQEIDIWVPHKKLAIEYDGKQHFSPVKYFGGEGGLADQIKRDNNKNKLIESYSSKIKFFIRFNFKDNITKDFVIEKLKNTGAL